MSVYRSSDVEAWFTEMMQRTPPLTYPGVEELLTFIFTQPDCQTLRKIVAAIVLKWRVNRPRVVGFPDLSLYLGKTGAREIILASPSSVKKQFHQEEIDFGGER